jgi:DNA-binding CsgD family transcriptional regulator
MIISERQSLLAIDLAGGRTRSLFAEALRKIAAAFGLSETMLLLAPTAEDFLLKPLIIESSLSAHYTREFDRAHLLRICPYRHKLRESAVPQYWHLAHTTAGPCFPAELQMLMVKHSIPAGIAFPVNANDGQRLIFWFGGDRAPFTQNEVNEFAMIVLHALDSYNAVKRNEGFPYNSLSARELEIVRWTAQGKTSFEIAHILTLSDHTVNSYMNKAIKKLDCVNRTQLVAKAIRLNLIS